MFFKLQKRYEYFDEKRQTHFLAKVIKPRFLQLVSILSAVSVFDTPETFKLSFFYFCFSHRLNQFKFLFAQSSQMS